jgi:DNA modification methylase
VPCIRLTHMTDAQRRAYILADNRIALNSGWDDAMLALELQGLETDGLDLGLMGFDEAELQKLLQGMDLPAEQINEDEIPEVPVDPVTKPGDLWTLGKHRLLCGDSTKAEDVARLLNKSKINAAITSPPYASQREYDKTSGFTPIPADEYVAWWDTVQQHVKNNLAADGSFFVNIKPHCDDGQRVLYVMDMVLAMVRKSGWRLIDELIWHKNPMPGVFGPRFKNAFEPIFHFSVSQPKTRFDNVRHESVVPTTVYSPASLASRQGASSKHDEKTYATALPSNVIWADAPSGTANLNHPAAYPVSLPSFFISAFSDIGDAVYDPFCGSGTTLIAAEQLGRKCYGMEISPQYCDVIVKRWETLTGSTATLEATL